MSKAGLEALVKTYAHEVASTPVRVNLVNPGPVRTAMRAKALPGRGPDDAAGAGGVGAAVPGARVARSATFNGRVVNFREWQKPSDGAANSDD